jgi:hypothetical protein
MWMMGLGTLTVGLLVAGEADARTERVRWTHPDPGTVERYTIHVGDSPGSYDSTQDVVAPPTDGEGAFYTDITVADQATVYLAVTAFANGLDSDFSNEGQRDPAAPPPPPPPPSASSAVVQFALIDANSDQVVDDDFRMGEQIYLADTPCAAIEVVGNSYLQATGAPGSVRFTVDDQVPTCNDVGVTHDDEPPYVLGGENGPGDFECSDVLAEVGGHSLSATPFDGNGCTGAQGTTQIITFTVNAVPAPPPPPDPDPQPEPLGRPGQPQLVPLRP